MKIQLRRYRKKAASLIVAKHSSKTFNHWTDKQAGVMRSSTRSALCISSLSTPHKNPLSQIGTVQKNIIKRNILLRLDFLFGVCLEGVCIQQRTKRRNVT